MAALMFFVGGILGLIGFFARQPRTAKLFSIGSLVSMFIGARIATGSTLQALVIVICIIVMALVWGSKDPEQVAHPDGTIDLVPGRDYTVQ